MSRPGSRCQRRDFRAALVRDVRALVRFVCLGRPEDPLIRRSPALRLGRGALIAHSRPAGLVMAPGGKALAPEPTGRTAFLAFIWRAAVDALDVLLERDTGACVGEERAVVPPGVTPSLRGAA